MQLLHACLPGLWGMSPVCDVTPFDQLLNYCTVMFSRFMGGITWLSSGFVFIPFDSLIYLSNCVIIAGLFAWFVRNVTSLQFVLRDPSTNCSMQLFPRSMGMSCDSLLDLHWYPLIFLFICPLCNYCRAMFPSFVRNITTLQFVSWVPSTNCLTTAVMFPRFVADVTLSVSGW